MVGTTARDWIIWLLFGEGFDNRSDFQKSQTKAFETYKERMRRSINRCQYEACTALLIHVLLYHNLSQAPSLYRPFITQKIVQSNLLKRAQLDQKEAFSEALYHWGLHKKNQQTLSLLLFSEKKFYERKSDTSKVKTTLRKLKRIAADIGAFYPTKDPLDTP